MPSVTKRGARWRQNKKENKGVRRHGINFHVTLFTSCHVVPSSPHPTSVFFLGSAVFRDTLGS